MTGCVFILGLIAVSGLVAYVGDNLGRKIGKAKLKIFGLRPKHTSIVVAIVTGMIITGITIGALTIFSKDVRDMLLHLQEIKDDLTQAEADYNLVSKELMATQAEVDFQKDLLASKDRDAILMQQEIDERKAELDSLNEQMVTLNSNVTDLNKKLNSSKAELNKLQVDYNEMESDLQEKENLINIRTLEMADLEAEKNRILTEMKVYESQVSAMKNEIAQLAMERDAYISKIIAIREGGIKVEEGKILAEARLSTSLSDAEIIAAIHKAEYEKWENNPDANIYGNPMEDFTLDQITGAIDEIRKYGGRFGDKVVVIRMIAAEHVFEQEEVPVILEVRRFLKIYGHGEIIAERRFSGYDDRDVIRIGILEMFEELRQTSQDKGMIFEGVDKAVTADYTVIVETARKASYYSNDFYIRVVAKRDIYNVDYLSVAPDVQSIDNMELVIDQIIPPPGGGIFP